MSREDVSKKTVKDIPIYLFKSERILKRLKMVSLLIKPGRIFG